MKTRTCVKQDMCARIISRLKKEKSPKKERIERERETREKEG